MSSKGKESDELLYTVRSLVMVRNQLPAATLIKSDEIRENLAIHLTGIEEVIGQHGETLVR